MLLGSSFSDLLEETLNLSEQSKISIPDLTAT